MTRDSFCKEGAFRVGLEGEDVQEENHLRNWLFGDLALFYVKHMKGEKRSKQTNYIMFLSFILVEQKIVKGKEL